MKPATVDSFEIIDTTGYEVLGGIDSATISAAAEHAARLDDTDPEVLVEWLNRDQWQGSLVGMPSDMRPGQFRKFLIGDVQKIVKMPAFKVSLREHRETLALDVKRAARGNREQELARQALNTEIEAEKELCPRLWELVLELQAQVATLRR